MLIPKLDRQQVFGALKATGSSDPDVLYARKEELLGDTHRLKILGIWPLFLGTVMTLTIIGAVVGIPFMIFGWIMRKRVKNNIQVAESTYSDYLTQLAGAASARAATA
jgi:hypothetical protein